MNVHIHITTRGCEISDELRAAARRAMEELSEEQPDLTLCNVVFEESHQLKAVAGVCGVRGGESIVAHAEGKEFEINLRLLADRMREQIRRTRREATGGS